MNHPDNGLEDRLLFLDDLVFVFGEYTVNPTTPPIYLDFLDVLEADGLVRKKVGAGYTATKEGVETVMQRRDRKDSFPVYKADPIGGTVELIPAKDPFESACDQTRYLMWDWMEYLDKHHLAVTHADYLNMWGETFNRVWAKMRNTGVMNNDR